MKRSRVAVYPGTFDPVTYGHIDIIKRAAKIYDKVIVAVAHNDDKNPLFSVEERVSMLKDSVKRLKNVVVDDFNGLAVDYVKNKGSRVMIRGLRMISDFESEFQMALTNRKLSEDIETIFMMPNESYSYISSKLMKEAAKLGADVKNFIPKKVQVLLKSKLAKY
ncbi:MAG: pantetheine-phosphate adenylyltransferase [Candidatus Omnitrophota bacterium]|jgi:pantetheine-phosphate adenylyltransferase|nr:pantetheine-phosphate adenylyltransferase [Candidatus Omnitrophota bacterium]